MTESYHFKGYEIPRSADDADRREPETFDAISELHIRNIEKHVGLEPDFSIVEIGCGIGRDAIPLSAKLSPQGCYLGVDIIAASIEWCTLNVTPQHPNFRFVHYDVRDQLHNPGGSTETAHIRIPRDDRSVDRIILQSVFTHMFRDDIEHYLREFRRLLKDSGRVYATMFIYDDTVLERARATNLTPWNLRFEHEIEDGCRINDPSHPTGAVAYSKEYLERMLASCGLRLAKPLLRGAWSGCYEDADDGQDVAIVQASRGDGRD